MGIDAKYIYVPNAEQRKKYNNDDDDNTEAGPLAQELNVLIVCKHFVYVFGGRHAWPTHLWRYDLRTDLWSKWRFMDEWSGPENLTYDLVATWCDEEDSAHFSCLFALCKDWDVYECSLRLLSVASEFGADAEAKAQRSTRAMIEELSGVDTSALPPSHSNWDPSNGLAVDRQPDLYFLALDAHHFYLVPTEPCYFPSATRYGTSAKEQHNHIFELTSSTNEEQSECRPKQWKWTAEFPCPSRCSDLAVREALQKMTDAPSWSAFVYEQPYGYGKKRIGILASALTEEQPNIANARRPECTAGGSDSQKFMLSCNLGPTEQKQFSAHKVHPDPVHGFPSYRGGAVHDVHKSTFYLVGGVLTNKYEPVGKQNRILDEVWRLDLDSMRWEYLTHARLPTPVFNASAKCTKDGNTLFVFGGIAQGEDGTLKPSDNILQKIVLD